VLLLLERRNLRLLVVLVDAALSSIALNVGELVDGDSVLLVERSSVQGLAGSSSLASGLIHGHEDVVLLGLAGGGELAQQELDKFGPAVFGDLGQAIDHNKCVETLLHVDLILLAEICALSASPFHRAFVWYDDCGLPEKSISSSPS
jgi:hypothetical protein